MPRRLRPLDPAEGPLQAFAYDLRRLRREAGDPTYRVLAATAGFSATTLSNAAGGVVKPTLEVTLAFVGACRGDVRLWEKRWHELDRRLAGDANAGTESPAQAHAQAQTPTRAQTQTPTPTPTQAHPSPAAGGEPLRVVMVAHPDGPVAESTPHAHPAQLVDLVHVGRQGPHVPRPRPWRSRVWWLALGTALGLVLTGLVAVRQFAGTRTATAGAGCPVGPGRSGAFQGTTYQGTTRVRASAGIDAPAVLQVPAGCALPFDGFCLGQVVWDDTSGTPDQRWFELHGGGLVSSAVVHGNPPAAMRPSTCPGALPAPLSIDLTATQADAGPGTVQLRATGSYLGIVGFAGYFTENGQSVPAPRWHQIGFTGATTDGFAVVWHLAGPMAGHGPVPVAAVACLGGDGPTDVMDVVTLSTDAPFPAQRLPLGASDQNAAGRAACSYPSTGRSRG